MSLNGILPVDKPEGPTSFGVVARLRGIGKTRRIGHAGTLDPAATGVLPLFFGAATRFIDLLPDHSKRYTALLQLGVITDTQDTTGTVLETRKIDASLSDVEAALSRFVGDISQLPPMYSAVKKDGVRLYELARKGQQVERSVRAVTIHGIELLDAQPPEGRYTIDVRCSKGTYIRTLCHDLGELLGCGGAMASLRRTEACGFSLAQSKSLAELQALPGPEELEGLMLPLETAFAELPRLELCEAQTRMFLDGVRLSLERLTLPRADGRLAVYSPDGVFLGLAHPDTATGLLTHIRAYHPRGD